MGEKDVQSLVCQRVTEWSTAAVSLVGLCVLAFGLTVPGVHTQAIAKTPGQSHCYKKTCHRVKTIAETRRLIGKTKKIIATHYDHPSVDRYNTGKYTSSGEVFNADDPTRTSSSNLPDGTELLVWNPKNGRAAHVRVNDFGPFHTNRKLDLTRAAAERLGFARAGVAELDVIVVAAPPLGEPRYKRARRYPAALGYLGVLSRSHIDALAERIRVGQKLHRMASIDIQKFLWSIKINELAEGSSVASVSPPVSNELREFRDAIGILPYAKASADLHFPPPAILAGRTQAPYPMEAKPRLRTASLSGALSLRASSRQSTPLLQTPARFGLQLAVAEKAGWRVPPSLVVSKSSKRVAQHSPIRLPSLTTAPIWKPETRAFEIATSDVNSIRWSIPGLDSFMRLTVPVWGTGLAPFHALLFAAALAVTLTILIAIALEWAYYELRKNPQHYRVHIPAPRIPVRPRKIQSPAKPAANVARFESRRVPKRTVPPVIRTKPRPAVIARGLRVDGPLASTGTVIVSGEVFGDCRCHTLVIQSSGRVVGNIEAVRVEIRGYFRGEINAASLIIEGGAIMDGDIVHRTIAHTSFKRPAERPYAIAAE